MWLFIAGIIFLIVIVLISSANKKGEGIFWVFWYCCQNYYICCHW